MFISQMKQSLEKLHQGIVVPEVQQDPPDDTLTESLTEAWAPSLLVKHPTHPPMVCHLWTQPGRKEGGGQLGSGDSLLFPSFPNQKPGVARAGELHYPQLSSPWLTWNGDVRLPPQSVTTSVHSFRLEAIRTTAIIYLQLQVICTRCMETGHWWADSDHPLLKNHRLFTMANQVSE